MPGLLDFNEQPHSLLAQHQTEQQRYAPQALLHLLQQGGNYIAPNIMSLMLGQPAPPLANMSQHGKTPSTADPRGFGLLAEATNIGQNFIPGPGPAKIGGGMLATLMGLGMSKKAMRVFHGGSPFNRDAFKRLSDDVDPQRVFWTTPNEDYARGYARQPDRLHQYNIEVDPSRNLDLTGIAHDSFIEAKDFADILRQKGLRLDRQLVRDLEETLYDKFSGEAGNGAEILQYLQNPKVLDEIASRYDTVKINEYTVGNAAGPVQSIGILNPNIVRGK